MAEPTADPDKDPNEAAEEEEAESISTISDSITGPKAAAGLVDGSDFLAHLRAAGAFDTSLGNEDTFGRTPTRNTRQDLASLSDLFELQSSNNGPLNATMPRHLSNDDTIGRSNKTSSQQAKAKSPPLNTLASLFEDPQDEAKKGPTVTVSSAPKPPPTPTNSLKPAPALKKPSFGPLSPNSLNESSLRHVTGCLPPRRPPSVTHHTRAVSWGNNTTFPPAATTQIPHLEEERNPDLAANASFDSVSSLGATDHRRNNTRTQFTIEDLLRATAPYETEAENNIIRAIESQQAVKGHRARLESTASASLVGSSLLGQVPETAAHDFSLEDGHQEDQASAVTAPLSPGGSERAKLLGNRQTKAVQRHRRVMSVEQTLVGLTNAMSALHGAPTKTAKTSYQGDPRSSADAFAQNATRLSEQQDQHPVRRNPRAWLIDNLPSVEEDRLQSNSGATSTDDNDDTSDDNYDVEAQDPVAPDEEDQPGEQHSNITAGSTGTRRPRSNPSRRQSIRIIEDATDQLKSEWEAWGAFFRPRKAHIQTYAKHVLFYVVIPLIGIATILFYFGGNPPTGSSDDGSRGDKPATSWWLIFTVRQVVTFSIALALQGLIVDFLALGTKIMLRLVGPVLTLLIVQSKGWPFICFWWSICDLIMLGNSRFGHHWLFWQEPIGLFNEQNPSGHVVDSHLYSQILTVVASISAIVAVKRFVIGLYLGRQTFTHYGEKLAQLMNKVLLVSEVAELAKDVEKSRVSGDKIVPIMSEAFGWENGRLSGLDYSEDATIATPGGGSIGKVTIIDTDHRDPLTGSLPAHEKTKLMQLLGQWEEPIWPSDPRLIEVASISSVLRFRKALTFIQKRYLFSYVFGPADTRENCIESAQNVYNRLLKRTPGKQVLEFETLALLALLDDDTVDQQKAKDLVKLFRPDRDGNLTMLDFVKSVDSVYRDFRMLNASIQNSSQIDRAFENMFNVIFYILIISITLSQLGFNPLALFLSLSSVILAFAFMIGTASSKYFEGVLFILVRRPYGIGDRIHISGVELDTSIEGSAGWVVENVTLFETIATWTPTKERCSLSNGSLAASRIINAARSPQAQFYVFLKFPIDTPYDRMLIFKAAIEEYMKARPREWLALNGFRAHRIVADQGYVEYAIVIQHRESWQNVGQILDSKANLCSYCNEVGKQLKMHYRAPPLPVDLRYLGNPDVANSFVNDNHKSLRATHVTEDASASLAEADRAAQLQEFRQIALKKHNIRLN